MAQTAPNGDPFAQDEVEDSADLNKLSYERLQAAGITIEGISPENLLFMLEQDGFDVDEHVYGRDEIFVRVRFDCSKLKKEQIVHMNLLLIGKDKTAVTTQHVSRKKGKDEKLEMIFFIDEKLVEHSYLLLLISDPQTEAQKRAGTLRIPGQRLDAKRIIQLAKKKMVVKEIDE